MKNVKLLTPIVGNVLKDGKLAGHFSYARGDVVALPPNEAKNYIDRGYAVPADDKGKDK